MAKSLRSKIKRRWRKLKKDHLDKIMIKPALQQTSDKLHATIMGNQYRKQQPKNAFLHPDDPTAQFPQVTPPKIIDLRSTSIPNSGFQWSGAQRKDINPIPQNKPQQEMQAEEDQIKVQRKHLNKKKRTSKLKKTLVF